MNILIPMCGISQYFRKENYRFPKPLCKIIGRPILFWLLDHLDTKVGDVIYIGIMESLQKQFDLVRALKIEYPNRTFEAVIIDVETRGVVETLFIMLQSLTAERLRRKTISLDCDTVYFQSIIEKFRQLPDLMNASFFFQDNDGKPIYSYLKLNENDRHDGYPIVENAREKIMISNYANTGAYAFRSASILKQYCAHLLDEAVGQSCKYYTTHVIKLMLDKQELFVGIPVDVMDFVCLGTPNQLDQFLRKLKDDKSALNNRKMRFCFDLDNTLVSHPAVHGNYSSVEPKMENIELVRELHIAGHYIIIQTARQMKIHESNVGAVVANVGRITLETLSKFDIPYDELLFGKAYADIYVDDCAIHALIDTLKEIGWSLQNATRDPNDQKQIRGFISSRHYHTIQQIDKLIIKSSSTENLRGEIYFYQNIPQSVKDLFPQQHHIEVNNTAGISSIIMEHINGITFSHLFTNLCLTDGRLSKLLSSLKRIHSSLPKETTELTVNIYANYASKVLIRYNQHIDVYKCLDEYFKEHAEPLTINSKDFLTLIIEYLNHYESSKRGEHNPIIHGDPVFSNALLTADNRVVFLDMRGRLDNEMSLQGDINYDLAKLYQSITGYDFIILNKYNLLSTSIVQKYLSKLKKTFWNFIEKEYSNSPNTTNLEMITAQLYFSLIPLHNNFKHQVEFYKLAMKLYLNSLDGKLPNAEFSGS